MLTFEAKVNGRVVATGELQNVTAGDGPYADYIGEVEQMAWDHVGQPHLHHLADLRLFPRAFGPIPLLSRVFGDATRAGLPRLGPWNSRTGRFEVFMDGKDLTRQSCFGIVPEGGEFSDRRRT